MTNTIPKGWTRAAAIQVNTVPSPYITKPGIVAVVEPYHKTPPGAAATLEFTTVEAFEAWRKWWFDAPIPNPNPSFTQQPFAAPKPSPAPWPAVDPFATKPAAPHNPFDTPKKPFNPFEK